MTPPWLDSLGAFGWREIVLVLAALLGLYVFVVFLRLRRIGRAPAAPVEAPPPAMPPTPAPALAEVAPTPQPAAVAASAAPEPEELPWVRTTDQRDERRRLEVIESEIVSMRSQIESLSETVALLVDESRRAVELRREQQRDHSQEYAPLYQPAAAMPRAVQPSTPLYGNAMELALAGHDAATIAERCGIARAEAELVVALAQQAADTGSQAGNAADNDTGIGGGGDGGQGRY